MKVLYIAGPYHGASYLEIDKHISDARAGAAAAVSKGWGFLCPHMNSAHFEVIAPDVPESLYREQDLRFLAACDAMLLVGDWQRSAGVKAELHRASELGMDVYTSADELPEAPS